jgi:hypothetical protein
MVHVERFVESHCIFEGIWVIVAGTKRPLVKSVPEAVEPLGMALSLGDKPELL